MPREKSPTTEVAKKRAPRKTPVKKAAKAAIESNADAPFVDPRTRAALIAEAAYYRAEKRGFAPGGEVADWQAAEAEVDAKLMRSKKAARV